MDSVELKVDISYIRLDEHASFDRLMSHYSVYGDLSIKVDGNLLPGTNETAAGEKSISDAVYTLMLVRRFVDPSTKISQEFVALSKYKYGFEYVAEGGEDMLRLSVKLDDDPVSGFECVMLGLKQAQEELHRFRNKLRGIFLENCHRENANRWWIGNVLEDFDDADNPKGKY